MNETWLFYLLGVPILGFLTYLRIKDFFRPERVDPTQDGIGLVFSLAFLAFFFWATVFDHPEARIGWFLGVLCGAALGFFDLRVTRIRNTPAGILVYSSRLIAALFLVAGMLWSASHGGHGSIKFENVADSPASMFFCTTIVAYAVVYINGLYSGRRFESMGPRRKAGERPVERVESGRRRGQR